MKTLKWKLGVVYAATVLLTVLTGCSGGKPSAVARPYPLDTCLVCDMKLSQMSKLVVFVYEGQEIKVCDPSEKADFEKDPAKYMKKLADTSTSGKQ